MQRFLYNLNVAIEAVFANKFRSFLTALGIIFGVAAVIAMLAIGTGAKVEIMRQIEMVGANNVIIKPTEQEKDNGDDQKKSFSPGLTIADVNAIRKSLPEDSRISPLLEQKATVLVDGRKQENSLAGVGRDYFGIFSLEIEDGTMWSELQAEQGMPVCVLGRDLASKYFPGQEAVGRMIKAGRVWLRVVGVLERRGVDQETAGRLSISEYDRMIFLPIESMLIRINDPSVSTYTEIRKMRYSGSSNQLQNQLTNIVISLPESGYITAVYDIVDRMLQRRHNKQQDFEIVIPEELIKQQQKTRDIFNIVLGSIAGISLLVGGIGIMNIMLASVMERTKEIGIRRALGATKKDVISQFLSEATLISITGGFIGVIFGFALSLAIERLTDIVTIVTPISVIISFTVSAGVGIAFGYLPAKRASEADPVESLRYS